MTLLMNEIADELTCCQLLLPVFYEEIEVREVRLLEEKGFEVLSVIITDRLTKDNYFVSIL